MLPVLTVRPLRRSAMLLNDATPGALERISESTVMLTVTPLSISSGLPKIVKRLKPTEFGASSLTAILVVIEPVPLTVTERVSLPTIEEVVSATT